MYKYRKGAAANLSKETFYRTLITINLFTLGHLDEHSRNMIMGHKKSGTFAYYVQVRDDTQSAFMETPARDTLLKLASNTSLTRDPSAPQVLTTAQKEELERHPELMKLKRDYQALRHDLISKYHRLHKAKGTAIYECYLSLQKNVRAMRKKIHESAKKDAYREFFENVGNHIIEQNYQGKPTLVETNLSHIPAERKALADLEFQNRDVDTVTDIELMEDRIRSLEMRLVLHKLNVPKTLNKRIKLNDTIADDASNATISMESNAGLECPVCMGAALHPRAKQYSYARKDSLQRHFETHCLPDQFPDGRICDYPDCDTVLNTLPVYLNHQATEHKIPL